MYILECCMCGEIKVVSSIESRRGVARACWTCPKCGAGQMFEIAADTKGRRGELWKIVRGLGFAATAVSRIRVKKPSKRQTPAARKA